MATLATNVAQAISDFDDIKTAIEAKGVTVGNVPTSQYASKIGDISGGGSGDNEVNLLLKGQLEEIDESCFDGVTSLTVGVFANNTGIKKIKFPDGFTGFTGNGSLNGCTGLQEVYVPVSYVIDPVNGWRLVPNTVKIYYRGTFKQWLEIPYVGNGIHGLVYINNQPLSGEVVIPEGIETLYAGRISSNSGITSLVLPSTMRTIGDDGIYRLPELTNITLNDGLTTFGSNAFRDCEKLNLIDVPNTVTIIGVTMAYSTTNRNRTWIFRPTTPPALGNSFSTQNGNVIIVPYDSLHAYKTATNWSAKTALFRGFGTFGNGVTLPATTTDSRYTLTWYASIADLKSGTDPITAGNGNEVYCTVA